MPKSDLHLAPVITLIPASEISRMLRALAADIEAGRYGEVAEAATVIRCPQSAAAASYEVFGWGHGITRASTHFCLHAGANALLEDV